METEAHTNWVTGRREGQNEGRGMQCRSCYPLLHTSPRSAHAPVYMMRHRLALSIHLQHPLHIHTPTHRSYPPSQASLTPLQVHRLIAPRDQKHQSNFVEFRNMSKIVYRRYAGLFFCACVDTNDNELAYLEAIHFFVEVLDAFFGNVCELDLVFNFYKVSGGSGGIWREGFGTRV
jgi:hypothetical protein